MQTPSIALQHLSSLRKGARKQGLEGVHNVQPDDFFEHNWHSDRLFEWNLYYWIFLNTSKELEQNW